MGLHDCSIYSLICRNASLFGEHTALASQDRKLTHRQLWDLVDQLATGLAATGVKRGDRIGILARNSLEFVCVYGAAARLGSILVPVNWRLKPDEIAYVISDASPVVLFAEQDFESIVNQIISNPDSSTRAVSIGPTFGGVTGFQDLLGSSWSGPEPDVSEDDGYLMIHTAAVQGMPRGAVLTQKNLLISALQIAWRLSLTGRDVNLVALPLFHVVSPLLLFAVMVAAGRNTILPAFDTNAALDTIVRESVTVFGEFPPMLKTLMERSDERKMSISSIRHVLGVDQPETINGSEERTGATFWIAYGQTETGGLVSMAPYSEREGSAGVALPLAGIGVEDDRGNILPPGRSGELVVTGPMIFKGYWNNRTDTEYCFRHGRHHTGDKGVIDENGYVWFEGRAAEKELIKPGGENVYPAEVENVLLGHPDIQDTCVIGVPDPHWGEAIKAICITKPGSLVTEGELIEFVASRIARYKKPKHVVFVPEFPRKPDGNADREKIKADHGSA